MSERIIRTVLSAEVAGYVEAFEKAERATHSFGSEAEKLQQKREAFNTLGTAAVAGGTAMVAMSVLAAKAAMDWQSAWAGVTKTVDGTPEQLAEVESGLRDLTSVLPASHEEIAAVAEAAGQLGIQTPNVVAFTRTMIDLGETTNLSANDAATSLARFVNIMGTSQDEVSNLGSALVGLGNNYATTEQEIMEMAMRLAGAGAQIGLSEGQVLGLATALSSVGIEAEAGGSAMSKVMIDIAAAVESGGDKLEQFASASGMSAQDFASQWRSDPAAALESFVKGLANAESQGQSTLGILADLGITEVRMRDALLRSSAAADQFAGAMAMGSDEFEKNNALSEEAAKRYETVESRIAMAGNAIRDAAIEFGEVFLGPAGDVADAVADIAAGFGDLPDPVQGAIAILTSAVGVTALVGGAALLAVPKIAEFRIAMEVLGISGAGTRASLASMWKFLTGPYGIAMIAATAAVVGLSVAQDKLKTSSEEFQNVIKNAKSASDLFDAADAALPWLSRIKEATTDVETFKSKLDVIANNDFLRGLDGSASQLKGNLADIGAELAKTAATDLPAAQSAFRLLASEFKLTNEEQQWLLNTMPEFRTALQDQASALGINVSTMSEAENAQALLNLAMGEAADPAADAEAALSQLEEEAAEADAALDGTAQALKDIASTALEMGDAKDAALGALNAMAEAADAEGVALDGTNDASIRLRDSIREVEQSHRDSAEAIIQNGGTLADAKVEWEKGREAVINMIAAKTGDREEAIRWADQQLGSASEVRGGIDEVYRAWLNLPENKETKYQVEAAEAMARLQSLKDRLASIPEYKRITLETFDYGTRHVDAGANETGNFYAYANGGIASNVPSGIYPGGAEIHKFAEKSLPWEAYISPKADQRERNFGVWKEAGSRLGFLEAGGSAKRPVTFQFGDVHGADPAEIAHEFEKKVRRSIALSGLTEGVGD